jgi:hypothetical protein
VSSDLSTVLNRGGRNHLARMAQVSRNDGWRLWPNEAMMGSPLRVTPFAGFGSSRPAPLVLPGRFDYRDIVRSSLSCGVTRRAPNMTVS